MLIALFIFEVLLSTITIFTTRMVENKFNSIEASLTLYTNKRAYKTKANIEFLEQVVKRYEMRMMDSDEIPDVDSIVKNLLIKEYIGRFPYISVKNLALRLRHVMWGAILLEITIGLINGSLTSLPHIIVVSASFLLTFAMEFYCILRGLNERSDALIVAVTDYVANTYPVERKKSEYEQEVSVLKSKIISLEKSRMDKQEEQEQSEQQEQLKAYKRLYSKEEAEKFVQSIRETQEGQEEQEDAAQDEKEVVLSVRDIEHMLKMF